jgi:predicted RNA binding protein YcfA (HicA-like mRNA interferase family)
MSKLPVLRPKDLAGIVQRIGFVLDRQKGSHPVYLRTGDHRRVVIPMRNRDLKPGTLHGLLRDIGISADELADLL